MAKALLLSLGGLLTALVLAGPARAEEPAKPAQTVQKTYAVVIGIGKYTDEKILPRPHAEADAKALYDLVVSKNHIGADPKNVRLLSSKADDTAKVATRANILEAIKFVAESASENDLVLFAFFGEGGPLGDSGDRLCYFASDSTFKGRDKDAVAASEIGDAFKPLKSKKFCTFVDVNFKGFNDKSSTAIAEPTLGKAPYKEFLGDDGSEDHTPLPGRVLFLATNGLLASLDLKDHGLFAQVIVDGLRGAADNEAGIQDGYEADGLVTVDELTKYIDKKIPELARKYGKNEKERLAQHFILGGRASHYVLGSNPEAAPAAQKRLAKFESMVKDGTIPAASAVEGRALLERMPRLKARQELRKAYQSLVDGKTKLADFRTEREKIFDGMELKRSVAVDFAQKVIEVTQIIRDNYVKEVNQGELVGWSIRGLYRAVEEKLPDRIEEKLKDVKSLREASLALLLADARQALGKREDLDEQKDLTITLQRMLHKLDPYTTYIDPETLKKFRNEIDGFFTGIGIQIRKDTATDQLLVVTPIKGSPAYRAKLMAGDIITHVIRDVDSQGEPIAKTEVTATKGMSLNAAVKLILGQPNTKVKLTIVREGVDKPFDVEITRARIEVESVLGVKRKTNDDWDYVIDKENKIGYIRLTSFQKNSYRDLEQVMKDLTNQGIKGFILDLRFNPGGLLDSAIRITDLFIDDGLIVKIRPRVGRESSFSGRSEGSLLNFPMVCLVNGYSASGSEIVSAALQDHRRAVIIGERSYGKGSVQNIQEFGQGEIKLTTASFWRPSGKNLNKSSTTGKDEEEWGVTPDKLIKLTTKERDDLAEYQRNIEIIERPEKRGKADKNEFKDRQLEASLEYLRGQIKMAGRVPNRKAG
jgi:C-terminal peptidase prc